MTPVAVLAASGLSALGRGRAAFGVREDATRLESALAFDAELASTLKHPFVGRVAGDFSDARDRAEALLDAAFDDLTRTLDQRLPEWRTRRVGVILGTSSGAMRSLSAALAARAANEPLSREQALGAWYFAPLASARRAVGSDVRLVQLLGACASSTLAIGLGCRWIESGELDLVIAGGYDALSALVASGFGAIGALTRASPRPFRVDRDGMAIGEGAGLVALSGRPGGAGVEGWVLGFGASSDAFHVTRPEPDGTGMATAIERALADAGLEPADIDLVSAHGTATPFNDAAEAAALARVFGERELPVFPLKAVIGHTLGAGGVLEALAAWDALTHGIVPAVPGDGAVCGANLVLPAAHTERPLRAALKLSAAFGGVNAALVLSAREGPGPGRRRERHAVTVSAVGPSVCAAAPELVARWAAPRAATSTLSRVDGMSELVLAAVAHLLEQLQAAPSAATAVIVGTATASVEQDELFDQRRRAGLPVEPRRFPPTSPNLCAGWCSIAFGFTGPSLAVCSGWDSASEALAIAHDLVAMGDAPAAIVVAAEDAGPAVVDLCRASGIPEPCRSARALLLQRGTGAGVSRHALHWSAL